MFLPVGSARLGMVLAALVMNVGVGTVGKPVGWRELGTSIMVILVAFTLVGSISFWFWLSLAISLVTYSLLALLVMVAAGTVLLFVDWLDWLS